MMDDLISNGKINYIPSEKLAPAMVLKYFIVNHPELLGEALSNPYIMATGSTQQYKQLYKDPHVAKALPTIKGPHREILSKLFASSENDKIAELRQDTRY